MNTTTSMRTGTVQSSRFLANFRSLRQMIATSSLRGLRPIERLDEMQLRRLMDELETGRYRISPANWMRLRDRVHVMELQEFGNRQLRNARTADENRYDMDNMPLSPDMRGASTHVRGQVVCLEDGRLAKRVDRLRAIPFCGLQVPVRLSDLERAQDGKSLVRWITGSVQCRRCDGYHLPAQTLKTAQESHVSTDASTGLLESDDSSSNAMVSEIRCPHCQGPSLNFAREGMVLIAHCLCGWEGITSLLGLDATLVAQNTQSVLAALVRDVQDEEELLMPTNDWDGMAEQLVTDEGDGQDFEESEAGDLVDTLVGMTEGTETSAESTESSEGTADQDEADPDALEVLDAVMTSQLVQFWASSEHVGLRRMLLDRTMCGQLTPRNVSSDSDQTDCELTAVSRDRLGLVWMVAATLTSACSRFTFTQQEEFVSWLLASTDAELRMFLPEGAEELPMPNVYAKIRSWMRYCRQRVQKFHSVSAGVRILSRQFGVSETAFRTAIHMNAVS